MALQRFNSYFVQNREVTQPERLSWGKGATFYTTCNAELHGFDTLGNTLQLTPRASVCAIQQLLGESSNYLAALQDLATAEHAVHLALGILNL